MESESIFVQSQSHQRKSFQNLKQTPRKPSFRNLELPEADKVPIKLPKVQSVPRFEVFKLEPVKEIATDTSPSPKARRGTIRRGTIFKKDNTLTDLHAQINQINMQQQVSLDNAKSAKNAPNQQFKLKTNAVIDDKIIIFNTEINDSIDNDEGNNRYANKIKLPNISKIQHQKDNSLFSSHLITNIFPTQFGENQHQIISADSSPTAPITMKYNLNKKRGINNFTQNSIRDALQLGNSTLTSHLDKPKTRRRIFELNLDKMRKQENKFSGNIYMMGIIKYDQRVYRDQKSQYMIISDQMSVLNDKITQFVFHLNHRGDQKIKQLFEYVTFEQQQNYNRRLEGMIAMIIVIGKSVLQEFGETPQKIGIKSVDHIVKKQDIVSNEIETLIDNFSILKEVFDVFKNCQSAYKIIQTNYEREAEDLYRMKIIIDLLDKTRYFCGELLERFKVIERNYVAAVIQYVFIYYRNKERRRLIKLEKTYLTQYCLRLILNQC